MRDTGVEPKVIRDAVWLACRAPSVHNTQPWHWRVEDDVVQLYVDPNRAPRRTDQSGREALIGCGAALDHFRVAMAAAGWTANVERFPNPNNFLHLASVDFTPMAGAVIGGVTGAAPGYELSVDWWKLNLSNDGEYVFDFGDRENDFFYVWSQLGIAPFDWLQVGVSVQRTRAYQTERDIQRGFFAEVTWRSLYFSAFVFNPDDPPTVILAIGASF